MHPNSDVNVLVVVDGVSEAAHQLLDILRRHPAFYSVQMQEIGQDIRITCIHLVLDCFCY